MFRFRPATLWLSAHIVLHATAVMAQTPQRAAIVPLDDTAMSRGLDAEAARVLKPTQMTVLHGGELDTWVARRREREPSADVLAKFAPATETIAKGVERFFYMSPDSALPSIEPVLDLAWNHPVVLAFRPDLADQIWQAGIVLVRAYAATRSAEEALAQAERLVTLLPSRQTDPKIVPPDTRDLLEAARSRLAHGGATLRLSSPDPANCKLYLNGAPAQPQTSYIVDPSGAYYAHADCSQPSAPPIWRVGVGPTRAVEMLVPPIEPQRYRPPDIADQQDRRTTEWYLQAVAGLADTDVTVGVASAGDEDAIILVRYDRATAAITWSDADYAGSIRRGMPRIFPEYASVFADTADGPMTVSTPAHRRRLDWPGVAFVGGGAAAAAGGAMLVVSSGRQARLLDCAVNNPSPPPNVDCSEQRPDIFFDDFSRETRKVGAVRATGIILIGFGALAAGYGVFRLLRRPAEKPQRVAIGWSIYGMEARW